MSTSDWARPVSVGGITVGGGNKGGGGGVEERRRPNDDTRLMNWSRGPPVAAGVTAWVKRLDSENKLRARGFFHAGKLKKKKRWKYGGNLQRPQWFSLAAL